MDLMEEEYIRGNPILLGHLWDHPDSRPGLLAEAS